MTLAGLVLPLRRRLSAFLPALLLAGLHGAPALAQQAGSPFVGFSQNRDQPINFEADRAEVFDNEKRAVLTGNVHVRQGESSLATGRLVILYEDNAGGGQQAQGRPSTGAGAQPGAQQNVRRFEMQGGVIVESKNQKATAERGSFDARRNEAILEGSVVLTQCENVMRGSRLQADLTANRVRLDGGPSTGGRVSGVLSNSSGGGSGISNPDCAPAQPARAPQRSPRG
jgi:lipopolysaccharide export system protein LptA